VVTQTEDLFSQLSHGRKDEFPLKRRIFGNSRVEGDTRIPRQLIKKRTKQPIQPEKCGIWQVWFSPNY
jgi:hypothetical protein